jgi:hypothetical protein
MLKRLIQILATAAVLFVLITWWALEAGGVAVIETETPEESMRSTHVWFVESDGETWIEAGTSENGWYRDIQGVSAVSFSTPQSNGARHFRAVPVPGASAHDRIRSQLRAKYGFRDWWINRIFDTTASIAVRLVPTDERGESR